MVQDAEEDSGLAGMGPGTASRVPAWVDLDQGRQAVVVGAGSDVC